MAASLLTPTDNDPATEVADAAGAGLVHDPRVEARMRPAPPVRRILRHVVRSAQQRAREIGRRMDSPEPVPDHVALVLAQYESRAELARVFRTVLDDGEDTYVVVGKGHVSWVRDGVVHRDPVLTFPIESLVSHRFRNGGGHSYSFAGPSVAVRYTGRLNGEEIAEAILQQYRDRQR
jgi:hypothetical protein